MNYLFILETDGSTGQGHLRRCLTLAKEASCRHEACLLIPSASSIAKDLCSSEGIPLISSPTFLDPEYKRFLTELLKEKKIDILVLDLTEDSFQIHSFLDTSSKTLIVSITLFDFYCPRYEHLSFFPDMEVLSSGFKIRSDGTKLRVYSGPDYFVFREEFFNVRKNLKKTIPPRASKVLITMGGGDPNNLTERALDGVKLLGDNFACSVILSKQMPHYKAVRRKIDFLKGEYNLLQDINNVADVMNAHDVAIINGGTTRYELALLGIPFIALSLHERQFRITEKLAKVGMGINLGVGEDVSPEIIKETVSQILGDQSFRQKVYERRMSCLDGNGAERIINQSSSAALQRRKEA